MLRSNLTQLGFAHVLTAGLVVDPALAQGGIIGPSLEQLTRGERPLIVGHLANFAPFHCNSAGTDRHPDLRE